MCRSLRPRCQKLIVFESLLEGIIPNEYNSTIEVKMLSEINEQFIPFANRRGAWYPIQASDLFSKGNICFVAVIDEKIASCLWTSFNQVYLPDIEYKLIVAKDIAPLIDGYTLDEYRGKGLYKILWNECFNYLVKSGKYSKIYGFINHANKRSLLVHDKLNLNKIILYITLIKFLGIRVHLKREIK
jgi:GNAT superfamily N-acetyltransferase